MSKLLIAGGCRDPNLSALIKAAQGQGIGVVKLLIGESPRPAFDWNLETNELYIDEKPLRVNGAFVRRDVFHGEGVNANYNALAWYTSLQGWLASYANIRCLNRRYLGRYTNKLHTLYLARSVGLEIPITLVTNTPNVNNTQANGFDLVAKPVSGGGYCKSVDHLLTETELQAGVTASPAIVQERLSGPDVRIYVIDEELFGFRISSEALDYRTNSERVIEPIDISPYQSTTTKLKCLMTALGLNWCATDFKLNEKTEELTFLEINSDPMFSVFDKLANGMITQAILKSIC